jgi:hypothetical protein
MDEKMDFETLMDALWDDFDRTNNYPAVRPKLAHYTTLQTLESILTGRQLWLSNPLYMNDHQEMRAGLNLGARLFYESPELKAACKSAENHLYLTSSFSELLEKFSNSYAMDTYIACFSLHDDTVPDGRLSMWRAYSAEGSGAALIFDTSKFPDVEAGTSPLVISRVEYITDDQREQWVKGKVSQLAALIDAHATGFQDLTTAAYHFIWRLKAFAVFTKHRGFSEENEWRLAYLPENDPDGRLKDMFGYNHGTFGIEPKLKLRLEPMPGVIDDGFNLDASIDAILCGPTVSSPLAVASFQRMLHVLKQEHLVDRVKGSTTPFRKTR